MPEPDTEFRAGVWWVRCPPESPSEWRTALPHEAVEAERAAVVRWFREQYQPQHDPDDCSACKICRLVISGLEHIERGEHRNA